MRGHVWFIGVSSVHPGHMLNEINFKISLEILFYREL